VAQEGAFIGVKKKKGKMQNRSTYSRRYREITTKTKPALGQCKNPSDAKRTSAEGERRFQGRALGREGENEEKNRGRIVIVMVK
jgi:hypothetical protein